MKKKKRRKPQRRERPEPRRVGPTPETRAKALDDPLQQLVTDGKIDAAGERAAEEIRRVFLAVCRDVMAKISRPVPMAGGKAEMSDELDIAHSDRYLPWVRDTARNVVAATLDLVLERRKPAAFMEAAICRALQDYARRFDQKKTLDPIPAVL